MLKNYTKLFCHSDGRDNGAGQAVEIQSFLFLITSVLSYVASKQTALTADVREKQLSFLEAVVQESNTFEELSESGKCNIICS